MRPRVAHFTDAGPGVGVSNTEVKFRDAELARLDASDYRIRVHRARGDSGQNEAERTNSAAGELYNCTNSFHIDIMEIFACI